MNVQRAIDRAADLCERIAAADFAPRGRLVRLLPFSTARKWSPKLANGVCRGWTCCLLDIVLADQLQLPRGQRAFVAILRDDQLQNEAGLIDVALHELAHDLEFLNIPAATDRPANLGGLATLSIDNLPANFATNEPRPTDSAGDAHSLRFIRAAAHVAYRARAAGWQTSAAAIHSCRPRLVQSLGDEPRERAAEPITAILDSPPPQAFSKIWSNAA